MTLSLAKKQQRIERLASRLNRLEKEQKKQGRKQETQRLILMGRLLENYLKWERIPKEDFAHDLNRFLTRNHDRTIFGLPPLADTGRGKKSRLTPETAAGAS